LRRVSIFPHPVKGENSKPEITQHQFALLTSWNDSTLIGPFQVFFTLMLPNVVLSSDSIAIKSTNLYKKLRLPGANVKLNGGPFCPYWAAGVFKGRLP
jgi:hypothetical protein